MMRLPATCRSKMLTPLLVTLLTRVFTPPRKLCGALMLCAAPRVTVIWRDAVTVWRPDALLGRPCNVVRCCVAGCVVAVVPRAGLLRRSV